MDQDGGTAPEFNHLLIIMNPWYHAESAAKRFGGKPEDYIELEHWLDDSKSHFADFRHRSLKHHSLGIFQLEEKFGHTITNSDGKEVPVRLIGEQHVKEDCGGLIPTVADWLGQITPKSWMSRGGYRSEEKDYERNAGSEEAAIPPDSEER